MEQGARPTPTDDETSPTSPVWISEVADETPVDGPVANQREIRETDRGAPSSAWIAALDRELTEDLYGSLYQYARRYAVALARDGVVDHDYTRQLVHDVLGDIFAQRVAWDPERHDLETRIKDVIRYRVRDGKKRAQKYPRVAIGLYADDERAEAEASAVVYGRRNPAVERMSATEKIQRIREQSADDPDALALIDAFLAGAADRADVCEQLGLSRDAYRRARERLTYRATHLEERICSRERTPAEDHDHDETNS